jgi:hypothetical protein
VLLLPKDVMTGYLCLLLCAGAIIQEWADKEFYCIPYKDSGTAVIGQTDEIQVCHSYTALPTTMMCCLMCYQPVEHKSGLGDCLVLSA